ncbi:MAG TPA: FAD-binding oxidoreductase [Ktedonobacteraceae bacterium]|nr:FAD-binding oxidoreductase [Ktedonobacteraceae bacterium]
MGTTPAQDKHEPESYWLRTVVPASLSSDLPPTIDVAVIGGGLLGTATSYWLAKAGIKTVLLERTRLAYGATGRNGGFMVAGTAEAYSQAIARLGHETARAVMTLTLENRQLLRQLLVEEEIECDYREPGSLSLALSGEQFVAMRQSVEALQADGFAAALLDREQVQALVKTPLGPEIVGGKFAPEQGLVHSAKLVQGLARAAQRHGAQYCVATALQLMSDREGVRILTSQGMLHAATVVVAINAWTSELLPMLAGLITPVRGQVLAYAQMPPIFQTGMSASISRTGEYWQQAVDGTIVLGGCREAAPDGDVDIRESRPTSEVQAAIEQIFPRLFPSLKSLRVVQRWAGLMAFTPDYLPIIDRVADNAGIWFVGGFSGHGMPFGLRLGQLIATAITDGVVPEALRPYRLARL